MSEIKRYRVMVNDEGMHSYEDAVLYADHAAVLRRLDQAHAEEVAGLRAEAARREVEVLRAFRVQIMGACPCGACSVPLSELELSDSGTVLTCEAGHEIVVDYRSPEERAKDYRAASEAVTLRTQLAATVAERDRLRAKCKKLERERLDIFDAGGYLAVKIALPRMEADMVRMATEVWIVEKIAAALRTTP